VKTVPVESMALPLRYSILYCISYCPACSVKQYNSCTTSATVLMCALPYGDLVTTAGTPTCGYYYLVVGSLKCVMVVLQQGVSTVLTGYRRLGNSS
jgi:hypothetical protein